MLEVRLFLAFLGHTHSLAQRFESATLPAVSSNLLSSSFAKKKVFISLQLPHPGKKVFLRPDMHADSKPSKQRKPNGSRTISKNHTDDHQRCQ